MKGKSLSCVQLLATPWTAAHQPPPSMGFFRQEQATAYIQAKIYKSRKVRPVCFSLFHTTPLNYTCICFTFQCHGFHFCFLILPRIYSCYLWKSQSGRSFVSHIRSRSLQYILKVFKVAGKRKCKFLKCEYFNSKYFANQTGIDIKIQM